MTVWEVFVKTRVVERRKHTQRHSRRSCFVISAEGGMTNKWSEAGIQLKYASGVAGHNRGEAAK